MPLSTMPNAGIPMALRKKAEDAASGAVDMSPEDWRGLVSGLLKLFAEEAEEPEHAEDVATDSHLKLALDRSSVRSVDEDGHMKIEITNISKANICPYKGSEIPGWNEETKVHALGLDPEKTYMLLRDPEELRKSVKSWNGKPLLVIHKPSNAEEHPVEETIGSVFNVSYDDPYLRAAMSVWRQEGIDLIETEEQREISCGYHYDPDMTPGEFNGEHFDGVMRNIRGNHVAIVEEGRAGPDVLVADSIVEMQWDQIEAAVEILAA